MVLCSKSRLWIDFKIESVASAKRKKNIYITVANEEQLKLTFDNSKAKEIQGDY